MIRRAADDPFLNTASLRPIGSVGQTHSVFLLEWLRARMSSHDRGASLVEYALLVALIAVVCIAAVSLLGTSASSTFSREANSISN